MTVRRFDEIEGGITSVPGFLASGVCAGIKRQDRADIALIYSREEAVAAATYTTNRVVAAPVTITRDRLKAGRMQAVIVNSGNANACTGRRGYRDAIEMTRRVADRLKLDVNRVGIASTGVIGQVLPMEKIRKVLPEAVDRLSSEGGGDAALAMMTTDTFPKEVAVRGRVGGRWVTVGGVAKGSGMIHPRMATMLAFIGTDMDIHLPPLRKMIKEVVKQTFNRVTVDGDTSTNDMVLCMANRLSGNPVTPSAYRQFSGMLRHVADRLAKMIVMDGEGATKFIEIRVKGAKSIRDAERAGFATANSSLVKTMFFGEDPNWGRIMAALGYSGAFLREDRIKITFDKVRVVARGMGLGKDREMEARKVMKQREFTLTIDLGVGRGEATVWTSDLSYDYVKINVGYRS